VTSIEAIDTWARESFERKNAAREQALSRSRELIRTCARTIRSAQRQEFASAADLLDHASQIQQQMSDDLAEHPDLYYTGYVQDALKELVEATATLNMLRGEPLPDPQVMSVPPAAFLNGLAESAGELRRYVLDRLRQGDTNRCESLLQAMDDIYGLLISMDYPDALTGGLRRTTDVTRGLLEKTRGDLTLALRQASLERKLAAVETQGSGER
jgi:translin